jgi:uncharacterized membrane protein
MAEHVGQRLHELEEQVSALLLHRAAADVNVIQDEKLTVGQRMADVVAQRAGSWRFIGSFLVLLAVWMALNGIGALRHWDPYPFILLNLLLSCVAALQAPVIMMSQNRQASRDRLQAENDYEVNVKAELLLEHLTEEVEALKRGMASLGARFGDENTVS